MQKNTRFIGEITFYKIERRLFILQLKVSRLKAGLIVEKL